MPNVFMAMIETVFQNDATVPVIGDERKKNGKNTIIYKCTPINNFWSNCENDEIQLMQAKGMNLGVRYSWKCVHVPGSCNQAN